MLTRTLTHSHPHLESGLGLVEFWVVLVRRLWIVLLVVSLRGRVVGLRLRLDTDNRKIYRKKKHTHTRTHKRKKNKKKKTKNQDRKKKKRCAKKEFLLILQSH
jgi:hypothetical protein